MTRREIERLRVAATRAINVFCDALAEGAGTTATAYVRPVATPDQMPDDLARQKARNELRRKGVVR